MFLGNYVNEENGGELYPLVSRKVHYWRAALVIHNVYIVTCIINIKNKTKHFQYFAVWIVTVLLLLENFLGKTKFINPDNF